MRRKNSRTSNRRAQLGAYVVEFAFVFLILFGLIYTTLCYGLLFTFRFALQDAAEDGARAALRHQPGAGPAQRLEHRRQEAKRVTDQHIARWLPSSLRGPNVVQVQPMQSGPVCGATWESRCSMVVTVTVTELSTVLPPFPAFALPNALVGKASVLLEGNAL